MPAVMVRIVTLLIALALAGWFGWEINGWRLYKQYAEYRIEVTDRLIDQQEKHIKLARQANELLAELDQRHTRKLNDAHAENERLRAAIRDRDLRLSVKARCPSVPTDPGTPSVDDGAGRVELDPAHAERIVSIPIDGDKAIRQLTALQEYVRNVCLGTENAEVR